MDVRKIYRKMLGAMLVVGGTAMGTTFAAAQDACCEPACEPAGCDTIDFCGSGCDTLGGCDSGPCCDLDLLDFDLVDWKSTIKRSDHCFDDFISPMINFVFFEDPRTLTELRPIFVSHFVPETVGNNVSAGGTVQLYALQFRVALSERLSLIAVKDGYIVDNTKGTLGSILSDGYADVSAGLKYNLIRDTQSGTLLSTGFTYEMPVGSTRSQQAIADGEFHVFATGGQRLLDGNAHFLSAVGVRAPVDSRAQNTSIHWSNHLDFRLTDRLYAFTEVAWWHWVDAAENGAALGVAGHDLFNLSTSDVSGLDLLTQNVGLKFKPRRNIETGIAYEFPLSQFQDITEGRLMMDMNLRY